MGKNNTVQVRVVGEPGSLTSSISSTRATPGESSAATIARATHFFPAVSQLTLLHQHMKYSTNAGRRGS